MAVSQKKVNPNAISNGAVQWYCVVNVDDDDASES